ncbi:hypothetical protein FQR65_LT05986 [Abscondita terminalis]|nr:hypothetical protein FQR65_LT05986 [Abscondita terminalis]
MWTCPQWTQLCKLLYRIDLNTYRADAINYYLRQGLFSGAVCFNAVGAEEDGQTTAKDTSARPAAVLQIGKAVDSFLISALCRRNESVKRTLQRTHNLTLSPGTHLIKLLAKADVSRYKYAGLFFNYPTFLFQYVNID